VNATLVALFALFDLAVAAAAIAFILRRNPAAALLASSLGQPGGKPLEALRALEQQVDESLEGSWNGDRATLPMAIDELLSRLDVRMREQGLPLDRERLKPLVAQLIVARHRVDPRDVREAMRQVA